jgi:hypothetical protein
VHPVDGSLLQVILKIASNTRPVRDDRNTKVS